MSVTDSAAQKRLEPLVLVETAELTEEEWLSYRRRGIGGSDVAALLGISPWRTARDLYYDKLNIAAVEDEESNWVALEMGHLLEPLVAKIFERKTGYKVYQLKKMFQHAEYPWMLADVDYFVELPDGTIGILEIKTTNYNARDNWWLDGEETVPVYYESQGRHYMAVMDVDRCFFCCLYGNNEEETIIREIRRDMAYEEEMIYLEQYFWENYVLSLEHPAFGGTAVNFLPIRQKPIPAADDVPHLIQRMEWAGHAGKGHVPVIVKPFIPQKRLVSFQVIDALQVGCKQPHDQIAALNRGGREHIGHVGTAVQNDEIHQLGGCIDQLLNHAIFDLRITQGIFAGTVSHQADERIAFQHCDMACHQRSVDLYAAEDLAYRGVSLYNLLRQPDREHWDADLRIDDDGFALIAGQGLCQNAGKHGFPAPRTAPDGNDFSH